MATWRNGFAVSGLNIYTKSNLQGRINLETLNGGLVDFYASSTFSGRIEASGSGTNYGSASDYRIKQNLITLSGAVLKVNSIPVYKANFIYNTSGTMVDVCMAHEVENIVPNSVCGEKDAVDMSGNIICQLIDYAKLTPLIVANIKEQTEKLEILENRLHSYLNK